MGRARQRGGVAVAVACAALAACGPPALSPPGERLAATDCQPSVAVLPLPPSAVGGWVAASSGTTYVGGLDHADGSSTPAVWSGSAAGDVADLGPRSPFPYGSAVGVSADGDVAVTYSDSTVSHGRAFVVRGQTWIALQDVAGSADVTVEAMNDAGDAVGTSNAAGAVFSPVLWPSGAATGVPLAPRAAQEYVVAVGLDSAQDVAGFADDSLTGPFVSALVWPAAGHPVRGPSLGGRVAEAWAVNTRGRVAGWARTPDGTAHAMLADPGQPPQDLGVLPGDTTSSAYALTEGGAAAGVSRGSSGATAVVWSADGQPVALPSVASTARYDLAYGLRDDGTAWGQSGTHGATEPVVWSCWDASPAATGAARPRSGHRPLGHEGGDLVPRGRVPGTRR